MSMRRAATVCSQRIHCSVATRFFYNAGPSNEFATDFGKLPQGIQFPIDERGDRSTLSAGKRILAAALRGAGTKEGEKLAVQVEEEDNWRFNYPKHFMSLVRYASTSPAINLKIARAGLQFAHDNFEYIEEDGKSDSLSNYMSRAVDYGSFGTVRIEGSRRNEGAPLQINYEGKDLQGEQLYAQLDTWVECGSIEPDVATAIKSIGTGNIDLTDEHFVLLGAGAAMSPLRTLLRHGATVVCIDIPGTWGERSAAMWEDIINTAKESSGVVIFPTNFDPDINDTASMVAAAGCNLLEQPAEVYNWLSTIAETKQLTIGNYTYLDGHMFVKLSMCSDSIMAALCRFRADTNLAFLGSPTDIHVIPEEAHQEQRKNYLNHDGRGLEKGVNHLSKGKYFVLNDVPPAYGDDGRTMHLLDGSITAQGPNFMLSKRLQFWRSIIAYEEMHVVSATVAPVTRSASLLAYSTINNAFGGLQYFKPNVVFDPETSSTLMATLLISNMSCDRSVSKPQNRDVYDIRNALEIFKFNSAHGGVWRNGYKNESILGPAAVVNTIGGPKHFWLIARLSVSTVITGAYVILLSSFGLL